MAIAGATLVIGWASVATAIVIMDSIGAGNFREQARRDQQMYQERLNALSMERDTHAAEAVAAQHRFSAALDQISAIQSELLASETRRHELETGIDVIQSTLRTAMQERDTARAALATVDNATLKAAADNGPSNTAAMALVANTLAETAAERDRIEADARHAIDTARELELEIELMKEHNDRIFRQLEEAMTISVEPLDKMFRNAGLPTDRIIEQVRRGYSGQGGPLTPITFSSRGDDPSADELRANMLLEELDRLNLYRIAAEKAPFANPVRASVRYTSGFGFRRDPITGGRRMHNGQDLAGPYGTNIYATADGIVTFSGWQSGYGRMLIIKHDFGIETRYAHNSRNLVKKGQRVSRGQHIADMGNTGRSTGTHLHYEVRVNGRPVNPMTYIKAARDVF